MINKVENYDLLYPAKVSSMSKPPKAIFTVEIYPY